MIKELFRIKRINYRNSLFNFRISPCIPCPHVKLMQTSRWYSPWPVANSRRRTETKLLIIIKSIHSNPFTFLEFPTKENLNGLLEVSYSNVKSFSRSELGYGELLLTSHDQNLRQKASKCTRFGNKSPTAL